MGILGKVAQSFSSKLRYIPNSSAIRCVTKQNHGFNFNLGQRHEKTYGASKNKFIVGRMGEVTGRKDSEHYFSIISIDKEADHYKNLYLKHIEAKAMAAPSPFHIAGSCDGVLLLANVYGKCAMWNPLTDQCKMLPPSNVERPPPAFESVLFCYHGLGRDASSGDFKVVRNVQCTYEVTEYYWRDIRQFELYSLKADSWRPVAFPHAGQVPMFYVRGSFGFKGKHYWVIDGPDSDCGRRIICFDFEDEAFSWLPSPVTLVSRAIDCENFHLVEYDGLLGFIYHLSDGNKKRFHVWVWSEGLWRKALSFDVCGVERLLGFWEKDKCFFSGIGGELLVFDIASAEARVVDVYDDCDYKTFIPFEESIMPFNGHSNVADKIYSCIGP